MANELRELRNKLTKFSEERDWCQFHAPKNLACALTVEAAELLEHFQWMPEKESDFLNADKLSAIESELADVFCYLLMLSDRLGIDLITAASKKIELNELRYPVDKSKGSNKKYTEI